MYQGVTKSYALYCHYITLLSCSLSPADRSVRLRQVLKLFMVSFTFSKELCVMLENISRPLTRNEPKR